MDTRVAIMEKRNKFQLVSIFDENLTENSSLTEADFKKISEIVKQSVKNQL
ncbi:MAG: hypothetical protein GWN01_08435 [Nitrosopumilaceae archaeon]|nr:hypothetical protein [Nitrosopumilaceae archaeon]NIU00941.1 hypothetical protein [Nitrosopumilaceae archaeon]NIU87399.1 hypothetical protein [Nitrosopumilaceae archaeon]NIV65921.1 hypothetical protein [Nitrosopumilaceae archaeon]NIX61543.1 hypothetical protein [Nitrosopumilaceae archaeon]